MQRLHPFLRYSGPLIVIVVFLLLHSYASRVVENSTLAHQAPRVERLSE